MTRHRNEIRARGFDYTTGVDSTVNRPHVRLKFREEDWPHKTSRLMMRRNCARRLAVWNSIQLVAQGGSKFLRGLVAWPVLRDAIVVEMESRLRRTVLLEAHHPCSVGGRTSTMLADSSTCSSLRTSAARRRNWRASRAGPNAAPRRPSQRHKRPVKQYSAATATRPAGAERLAQFGHWWTDRAVE